MTTFEPQKRDLSQVSSTPPPLPPRPIKTPGQQRVEDVGRKVISQAASAAAPPPSRQEVMNRGHKTNS